MSFEQGDSNEYLQHMFFMEKCCKLDPQYTPIIWSSVKSPYEFAGDDLLSLEMLAQLSRW